MTVKPKAVGQNLWEWAELTKDDEAEPIELDAATASVTFHAYGSWAAGGVLIEGTLETETPSFWVPLHDYALGAPMRLTVAWPLVTTTGGVSLVRPHVFGPAKLTVRCRTRRIM